MPGSLSRRFCLGLLAAAATTRRARAAEPLRIGLLRTLSPAPLYLAMQRAYFAANGIDAQFRFFESAQPIAAAAVSGDIDVGLTALTGGFFNLAGRGALKVIGGGLHEEKGWQGSAILVSRAAYDAGLTSVEKLGGHSFGITQYGSSFHYMVGRLAEVAHFDLRSVTLRPLQDIGNMVAAVSTGQVDATIAIASMARPVDATGKAKIIGWIGDYIPYQVTAVFTTQRMIDSHAGVLHGFAAAYAQGIADYRQAFLRMTPDGHPVADATTVAAIPQIEAYVFTGDPNAARKIAEGVGWYDEGGALDVQDVSDQLRWFLAQGMVKGAITSAQVIDTQFIRPLPPRS